jgi:catechol 2,3-dioxygenase-like lactoylglutathione lyase family enzyme
VKTRLSSIVVLLILTSLTAGTNVSTAPAQESWATLEKPPSGVAPAGDVLRPGHLGRQIGNVELMIHFYHDLIGLNLMGPRARPRPFGSKDTNPALLEFAQLGQSASNPMDARNRAVILPIPGTSASKGSEMAIEAIEIKKIASKPYKPLMTDPGASYIKLIVRDLDKTLAILKDELVPVITIGEKPVTISDYPGVNGKIRAVFVRDPDGYPVGLMEISPAPATSASSESKVLGAVVSLIVEDLETTCRWFQDLVGKDLKFWVSPSFIGDENYSTVIGTIGRFRLAQAMIPGSPVIMEFIQYEGHNESAPRPNFQDPGAAHILFMAKDVDVIMPRVRAAGLQPLSGTGGPTFIGPETRSFFITGPDGFWAEFMDHGVKRKQ